MYMHEIRARTWDIYIRKVTKSLFLSLSFSLSTTLGEGWREQSVKKARRL